MSTPSSKRQRTLQSGIGNDIGGGGGEGKEEKGESYYLSQVRQLLFPSPLSASSTLPTLPIVPILPRDWFCVNTALSRRVCIQRTPRDIENWTTKFNSGLQGGMTEDECLRTCVHSPQQSSSSSSSSSSLMVPPKYAIPGNRELVEVPGMNLRFVNNLVASMLTTKDIRGLIPTSRANYVGIDPEQKNRLELEVQLLGLASEYSNQRYLNAAIKILQLQDRMGTKFLSYPLLIKLLPPIYSRNPRAFWTLTKFLPLLERFVIFSKINLTMKDMQDGIAQGMFSLNADNTAEYDVGAVRELWNLRDGIFSTFYSRFGNILDIETEINRENFISIINWFLTMRRLEEVKYSVSRGTQETLNPFITKNIVAWYDRLAKYRKDSGDRVLPLAADYGNQVLATFLERRYYGPIRENKRIADYTNYKGEDNLALDALLAEPIIVAIDLNSQSESDTKLQDLVAQDYSNPSPHVNQLLEATYFFTAPVYSGIHLYQYRGAEEQAKMKIRLEALKRLFNPSWTPSIRVLTDVVFITNQPPNGDVDSDDDGE